MSSSNRERTIPAAPATATVAVPRVEVTPVFPPAGTVASSNVTTSYLRIIG